MVKRRVVLGLAACFLLVVPLLFLAAGAAIAGTCTSNEEQALRAAGISEQRIAVICKSFPIWDRDGKMQFNGDGEYVGSTYPSCRYRHYGDDYELCVVRADARRAAAEATERRRQEEHDRWLAAQERQCEAEGRQWYGGSCMSRADRECKTMRGMLCAVNDRGNCRCPGEHPGPGNAK
jgi:hypothetical protein